MKMCLGCRVIKPLSEYHKNSSAKDGRRPRCKECMSSDRDYGCCDCKYCGKEFKKKTSRNIYCSDYCKSKSEIAARSNKPKFKNCKNCSKEFEPYTSLDKFCSAHCRVENMKSERSRRWSRKSTVKRMGKNNPAYRHGNRSFGTNRSSEGQKLYLRNRNKFWGRILEEKGYLSCEDCGATGRLETHHIVFRSEKPNHKFLHDERNFLLLCVSCHNSYHANKSKRNRIVKERKLNKLFGDDVLDK